MRRIVSVLLENESGALSRLIGLFAQRGYNIETLTVAPTEDHTLSRLTLTTVAGDDEIEQITKQVNKLVEVVKLVDLSEGDHVERELMLIKVKAKNDQREEIKRIVDVVHDAYTIQLTGTSEKIDAFVKALPQDSVAEVARSGVLGLSRGEKTLSI